MEKAQNEVKKQKELLDVYRKYQQVLEDKRLFDFDDMILRVVEEAYENGDFLRDLQEQFLYLLIDEHQDTNSAQNELVDLIASAEVNEGRPNIFVVGDKKQAIYKFQGATIEEFERIKNKYNDVKVINLKNNYRSSQNILDTAFELISEDEKLEAHNEKLANHAEKIQLLEFPDRQAELVFLAEQIKADIKNGVNPNEIAVFFRKNREAEEIADILEKAEVSYKLFANEDILKDKDIQKFILLLSAVQNPYQDEILSEALFVDFLNLNPLAVVKVLNRLSIRDKKKTIYNKSVFKIISSESILKSLDLTDEEQRAFLDFSKFLTEAKEQEKNLDFLDFLNYFVNASGFLGHILSLQNNILPLSRFEKLFNEVKQQTQNNDGYSLEDFLRYVEVIKAHNLKIEVGNNDLLDGVNLMTAHKSKGLEFERVYLTGFTEKKWSGKGGGFGISFLLPTSKAKSDLEDERRLFYVALTRAKKDLKITYALTEGESKRVNEVSQFARELGDVLEEAEAPQKSLEEKLAFYFQEKTDKRRSIFDLEYIQKLFLSKSLSVTALNNYKKSPILYFFRNLIQIPSGQSKSLIFGNVIHDVLENYFKEKGERDVLEIFEESLEKFKIPEKYFAEIERSGKRVLQKYIEKYKDEFVFEDILLEQSLHKSLELPDGNVLTLTGFADKIEKNKNSLTVVDYKTGYKDKSKRNKAKEDLHRQLAFYKLLIDSDNKIPGQVDRGVVDFVEEMKDTGNIEKREENLTDKDVDVLREEIEEFAKDILSGEFLHRKYNRFEFEKQNKYDKHLFDLWELLKK